MNPRAGCFWIAVLPVGYLILGRNRCTIPINPYFMVSRGLGVPSLRTLASNAFWEISFVFSENLKDHRLQKKQEFYSILWKKLDLVICGLGELESSHLERWASTFSLLGLNTTLLWGVPPGLRILDKVKVCWLKGFEPSFKLNWYFPMHFEAMALIIPRRVMEFTITAS